MAVFECKLCGSAIEAAAGETVCRCPDCMTEQTLPDTDDEKILRLYRKAGYLRNKLDFERAEKIAEMIVSETPEDAEAYWSLVLCRYGAVYKKDQFSSAAVLVSHTASYTSVYDDPDYQKAISISGERSRAVYESEAAQIEKRRNEFLDTAKRVKLYDIFICCIDNGKGKYNTAAFERAKKLYDILTEKEYKVFLPAAELENVPHEAYEAYIFSALNNAKAMIVPVSDAEMINAAPVRKIWKRYLEIIKKNEGRTLLPCYIDISPDEFPDEFLQFREWDMSSPDFAQKLTEELNKLTGREIPKNVEVLKKITFDVIADGDWQIASQYCDNIRDIDPGNTLVYLCRLMIALGVRHREDLMHQSEPFDDNEFYRKIMQSKDKELKAELRKCTEHINERNRKQELEGKYNTADNNLMLALSIEEDELSFNDLEYLNNAIKKLDEAVVLFGEITDFRDSAEKISLCQEHRYKLELKLCELAAGKGKQNEEEKLRAERKRKKRTIITVISCICVAAVSVVLAVTAVNTLDMKYENAARLFEQGEYEQAQQAFEEIAMYRDSAAKAQEVSKKAEEKERSTKNAELEEKYKNAKKLLDEKKYEQAAEAFKKLGDFRDSAEIVLKTRFEALTDSERAEYLQKGNYLSAETYHTVGLNEDGSVVVAGGDGSGQEDVSSWKDITAVSGGFWHTVGLKKDGTVIAAGNNNNGQCNVRRWKDIVDISAGVQHTVGLTKDGTVVITAKNAYDKYGMSEAEKWTDIIAVSAGDEFTAGLKADGTVVIAGESYDVSSWRDIAAVSSGAFHVVGLCSDGTVYAAGKNDYGQCDVSSWRGIVAVSAGKDITVGLRADGTVVTTGYNQYGQSNVSGWKDIAAVSAGEYFTVGMKADGTVVATGENKLGQCEVSDWKLRH